MIALGIVLIALVITSWVLAIYSSWRAAEGNPGKVLTEEIIDTQVQKYLRLMRRGWYGTERTAEQALRWSGNKTRDAVVKVFPGTAPVFEKAPDALTGLKHGPSSYFLKSISEKEPVKKKRLPSSKKMI